MSFSLNLISFNAVKRKNIRMYFFLKIFYKRYSLDISEYIYGLYTLLFLFCTLYSLVLYANFIIKVKIFLRTMIIPAKILLFTILNNKKCVNVIIIVVYGGISKINT